MKNFEKYKDYLLGAIALCNSDELLEHAGIGPIADYCTNDYYTIKKTLVDWLLQEYKESILDVVEKSYLEGVIKPFRKNVIYISKIEKGYESDVCFIAIVLNGGERIHLPYFNTESGMYAGMQPFLKYSLEELGLWIITNRL